MCVPPPGPSVRVPRVSCFARAPPRPVHSHAQTRVLRQRAQPTRTVAASHNLTGGGVLSSHRVARRLHLAAQGLERAASWLLCTAPWRRRFGRHVGGRCAERVLRSRCFPSPQVHQLERTTQTVTDVSAPLVSERMCVRRYRFTPARRLTLATPAFGSNTVVERLSDVRAAAAQCEVTLPTSAVTCVALLARLTNPAC